MLVGSESGRGECLRCITHRCSRSISDVASLDCGRWFPGPCMCRPIPGRSHQKVSFGVVREWFSRLQSRALRSGRVVLPKRLGAEAPAHTVGD